MNSIPSIRLIHLRTGKHLPLSAAPKCAVALGNFDGVHCAHRLLLMATLRKAAKENIAPAVFCFDPPPSDFLPHLNKDHLSTLQEKLDIFAACGIEYAFLADFPTLKDYAPAGFVQDILCAAIHAETVICGFNFHFGRGGSGTTDLLGQLVGTQKLTIIPPLCMPIGRTHTETVISSGAVRSALIEGDVATAHRLLGQPYSFTSEVVRGKQLGRTLGLPTINQYPPPRKILPANGIYVTRCLIRGQWYPSVSNIGIRPTVDTNDVRNCETHVLDFSDTIYGQTVTVQFLKHLRNEHRFDSVEQLRLTIQRDVRTAKEYFKL